MKQPTWAPVALGGGLLSGVSGLIIGVFSVGDCVRFQTRQGECTDVVKEAAPLLVLGASAIFAGSGGLFTYNRKLERPEGMSLSLPEPLRNLLGKVEPPPKLADLPLPSGETIERAPKRESTDDRIKDLKAQGWTETHISEYLGISRYKVRKALGKP